MPSHRLFHHARVAQAGVWLVACGLTAWQYPHALGGVLCGGGLMAVNLALVAYLAGKLRDGGRPKTFFAVALGGKFVLLMAGVVGLMQGFNPDLLGFAIGLATFFAGMAGAIFCQWRQTNALSTTVPFGPVA